VLDATVIESSMINPLEQDYRMNLSSESLTGKGSGVQ